MDEGGVRMIDIIFKGLTDFGNGPVANFSNIWESFCLDESSLRERIANIKKRNGVTEVEDEALRAILKAKAKIAERKPNEV